MSSLTDSKPATGLRARGAMLFRLVFGLAGLGALLWLGHYLVHAWHHVETDDAYVTGHLHQVSSQVGGRVLEVLVEDNQQVAAGAVLARLDPLGFQIAVDRATAALEMARAQKTQAESTERLQESKLEEARSSEVEEEAKLKGAEARLELAQTIHRRNLQLFANGQAATQADLEKSQADLDGCKASADASRATLSGAHSGVASASASTVLAREQSRAALAAVAAAEGALREAERQLSYATIVAPAPGRVGNKKLEVGNMIQASQTLLTIAEPTVWVIANFKETQLARMREGQEVTLTVDALPGEVLHGKVDSFSPASGAQFALLPPDNATGNFNKVVQRVPVKIVINPADVQRLAGRIRLGLSVVVEILVR